MRVAYLDTSAALKLVVDEPCRPELLDHLAADDLVLTASWLLHTEMFCAAGRRPEQLHPELIRQALDAVEFVDVTRADLIEASRLAPLRSNDAVHLAVALRLEAEELLTYDAELADAARRYGVRPVAPGR